MGHVRDTAFLPGQKTHITRYVGDTAFLLGQKTYITIFAALGGLAHSEHLAVYWEHSAL